MILNTVSMFHFRKIGENASKSLPRYLSAERKTMGNNNINPFVYNRNPRNLERLRIAYKPSGYHLEKPGRDFWHKLVVKQGNRNVTASIVHNSGSVVVTASSGEWAIRKHLYRCTDTAAYVNLARVFAQRCIESGIIEMYYGEEAKQDTKMNKFLEEVKKEGLTLEEPPRFIQEQRLDKGMPEKPWEVIE